MHMRQSRDLPRAWRAAGEACTSCTFAPGRVWTGPQLSDCARLRGIITLVRIHLISLCARPCTYVYSCSARGRQSVAWSYHNMVPPARGAEPFRYQIQSESGLWRALVFGLRHDDECWVPTIGGQPFAVAQCGCQWRRCWPLPESDCPPELRRRDQGARDLLCQGVRPLWR